MVCGTFDGLHLTPQQNDIDFAIRACARGGVDSFHHCLLEKHSCNVPAGNFLDLLALQLLALYRCDGANIYTMYCGEHRFDIAMVKQSSCQ